MEVVTKSVSLIITISLLSLRFAPVSPFGLTGLLGWGGESESAGSGTQNTIVITPPAIIQRYPLHYPFRQCSHGMEGVMTSIFLYHCMGEGARCVLNPGKNVTLDLEFISNIPTEQLVGTVTGIFYSWFRGATLGPPKDLCKSEYITCPIQPFYQYRYRTSIRVAPGLPEIDPDIKVLITADNGRNIACAIVSTERVFT